MISNDERFILLDRIDRLEKALREEILQHQKDVHELETGTLAIGSEISEQTIFILRDGTIINAEFNEYGDRCTDHRQVLAVEGYDMGDMITIEPESGSVILPYEFTWQQVEAVEGLEEFYPLLEVQSITDNTDIVCLVQYFIDCGLPFSTSLKIIYDGTWAVIPNDELDDYSDEDKEEFLYLDNGTVVDVW